MATKTDAVEHDTIPELAAQMARLAAQVESDRALRQRTKESIAASLEEFRGRMASEIDHATRTVRAETERDVAQALEKVSGASVDKTLKIVEVVRNWVIALVISLFVGLSAASINFYQKLSVMAENLVTDWLSVNPGSPFRAALEKVKTRALLDSYMIRDARLNDGDPFDGNRLGLSSEEVGRLLTLMRRRDTDDADFDDAAHLVALSRGPIVFRDDTQISETATLILGSGDFDGYRKYNLMKEWAAEPFIQARAAEIIKNPGQFGGDFEKLAFRILSRIQPELAIPYALSKLKSGGSINDVQAAAELVAETDPTNQSLRAWIETPGVKHEKDYPLLLSSISQDIASALTKTRDTGAAAAFGSNALATAIDEGAYLYLNNFKPGFSDIMVAMKNPPGATTGITMVPLDHLKQFLDTSLLVSPLLQKKAASLTDFAKAVSSLQVVDRNTKIAQIGVDLDRGGVLVLRDGSRLSRESVDGHGLLTAEDSKDSPEVTVAWKFKNGTFAKGSLQQVEKSELLDFHYAYDADIIGRLEFRRSLAYFH